MSDEGKVVPGAAVGKSGAGCFKLSAEERMRLTKDQKVAAKKELVKGKVRDEAKKGSKKNLPVAKKSAPSAKKTGKIVKAVKPGKVKQGSKQEKSKSVKEKKAVGAKSKKVLAPKK